jgi:predicted RND superfamily exporter protein
MITAGLMGYFESAKTIHNIGFSIAFGLSVDDTIHFLAQYRQELTRNNWKIKRSVFATIRESGLSMFYTSVVLFSVFRIYAF